MSAMENTEVRNIISETFKCYASVTLGGMPPPPAFRGHAARMPVGMPRSASLAAARQCGSTFIPHVYLVNYVSIIIQNR